jgi:hypothetical protein
MVSVAEGLRMMQGGVDRTGFADMADQLGNPGMDLILQRRAAAEEEAGVQEILDMMAAQIPGGEEPGGEETGGFNFGGVFDDYIPESILSMPVEDMEKMDELAGIGSELKIDANRGLRNISTPKVPSTGVPKTGKVAMPINEFKPPSFGTTLSKFFKRSPLGLILAPTQLAAGDFELDEEGMPIYPELFNQGMADGGRVEMQLGGGIMNALLGSPQVQNAFQQYRQPTMDFSQVASSSIPQQTVDSPTPAQAYTPFVSTMPLYDPSTLGTGLPSTAGMADPYFVYDPYSPVGAFDTPKAKTTGFLSREQIDKGFSDLDKFDVRKQKQKKEEEEAKKKKKRGGGSQEDRARNKARRDAMTERAREHRNRQRGGSGKGTSDPGGQEARGA